MHRQYPTFVLPRLSRAISARPASAGRIALGAWSLAEPSEEVGTVTLAAHAFLPEEVVHVGSLGNEVWVVTGEGRAHHLTSTLEPLRAGVLPDEGRPMHRCAARGTRLLVTSPAAGEAIFDVATRELRPLRLDVPRMYGDEVEGTAYALDARCEHVAASWYWRYAGCSTVGHARIGAEVSRADRRAVYAVADGEVVQLAVSPGGAVLTVLRGGRALVVPAMPATTVDAEPLDVGDALAEIDDARVPVERIAGAWSSEPPATAWGDFLDRNRVLLVGQKRARVLSVVDGSLLGQHPFAEGEVPLALDREREELWVCTSAGFRAVPLGSPDQPASR